MVADFQISFFYASLCFLAVRLTMRAILLSGLEIDTPPQPCVTPPQTRELINFS